MAACAVPSAAQLLSSEEKTLANGLRMVHVESTAFEEVALAMHWQFKPGLELAKTGTREAWAMCLDAQWRSDTLGTGWDITWEVTPFGFLAQGNAAGWQDWSAMLLEGILNTQPESQWERMRSSWVENWATSEHQPHRMLERAAAHALFTSRHVYGEVTSLESLGAIAAEDIAGFKNAYWWPNNCTFALATPSAAAWPDSAENILSGWTEREVQKAAIPLPTHPRQLAAAVIVEESLPLHASAGVTLRLKPDHPDALATRMLIRHLEETSGAAMDLHLDPLGSRLLVHWPEANVNFKNECEALFDHMRKASRTAIADSTVRALRAATKEDYEQALTLPARTLELLTTEPVVFSSAVTGQLASAISSVQVNDLQRVAINYLRPDQMHIILAGSAAETEALLGNWIDPDAIDRYDHNIQPISAFGPAPDGMSALDVLQAHYEACGGVEAFERLRSCRKTGSMSAGGGLVMDVESVSLFGVGHRTSISVEDQVMMEQLVRPRGGISMQMGKRRAMTDAEYQRYEEGMYAMPLLAADLRGLDVKLAGTTSRSGSAQYVIETYRDERLLARYFFDAASHLLVQRSEERTGPTGPVLIKTRYANYRAFEGLYFPTEIVQRSNNQDMVFSIESVLPGARVDKKQFEWE